MIRLLWRSAALILLLFAGLLIIFSFYRFLSKARQSRTKKAWSRLLVGACGLRICVQSDPLVDWDQPTLIVLNHVSWLDIFVVNAVLPATFVAKSEIRNWPLVGWLVSGTRTIFVERGSRHAVRHTNREILRRLAQDEPVAFFPEGTTTDGTTLLPFHASLFAVALPDGDHLKRSVSVVPALLRYTRQGKPSEIPAYTGDQTLVNSVLKILACKGLEVNLHWLDPLPSAEPGTTRHDLAQQAEQAIRKSLLSA
jgi:1-acyl-sn-glycerol-3-phosphate acyltransferase